ncbi:MAG TPA: GHKL domain-containing protein [Clostridiales bacterium]|nr:GHKL domain-containing protein [Clostridiales bacterium]
MGYLEFILNNIFFVLLEGATLLILFLIIMDRLSFLQTYWMESLFFIICYLILHQLVSNLDRLPLTLFYFIYCILALAYLTKTSLYSSILANIIAFIIYEAIEVAVSLPVLCFMGCSVPDIKNDSLLLMKTMFIIRPIQIIITLLLTRFHIMPRLFRNKLHKKSNSSVTYYMLIVFFMAVYFIYMFRHVDDIAVLLTSGILFLTVILLSFLDKKERIKLVDIENKFILQEEYSRNMERIVDAVRKEKHDFKNHISTLIALCSMPEAGAYAADKVKAYAQKLAKNEDLSGLHFYNTGNKYLDGLLSVKNNLAISKGIHFEVNVETTLEMISVDDVDLTSIVGNILDNAFDAVLMNPPEKKKIVSLLIFSEGNKCFISISNNGSEIPEKHKKHIFDYKYSTKEKAEGKRGYGLYIVKELVSRNKGEISFHSNEFETEFFVAFQNKADNKSSQKH